MTTKIIGTGHYVPEYTVTNDDLAKIMDTNDDWIVERTGIHRRRIDTGEGTSKMALKAAKAAISDAGIEAQDIDLIIVATSSADYLFPNTACIVQRELGNDHCMCFDLAAACTGFIYALSTANAYINMGMVKNALLIGSECLSKTMDWTDRGTAILFGDGAGAAVVTSGETGIEEIVVGADGRKADCLICDSRQLQNLKVKKEIGHPFMEMDGQEVFRFAVKKVPECILELLEKADKKPDEIDYYLLHQANQRIIRSVAKRLKVSIEKFPINLNEYGNTSAASIPILLDECRKKIGFKPGDKIVISGFGAGLTWGALLITW